MKLVSIPAENDKNPFRILVYEEVINGRKHYFEDPSLTKEIQLPDMALTNYCTMSQIYGYSVVDGDPVLPQPVTMPVSTKEPTPYDYAMYIAGRVPIKLYNNMVYQYENGYYRQINDSLLDIVLNECRDDMAKHGTISFAQEVEKWLRNNPDCKVDTISDYSHIIPFPNGLLNLNSGYFSPPDYSVFLRWMITVPFEPYNWYCPVFMRFLDTVTVGNQALQLRLLEIMGYILSGDNDAKKFFVFAGVGNSGKSVLINLITSLLPKESVYYNTMNGLADKFQGYINGTQLCVFADMPDEIITNEAVAFIKGMTGDDGISARRKYQGPEVLDRTIRLLFATNHPIRLKGCDNAFWDRLCVVPFMLSIPPEARNPYLLDDLRSERPAIVNHALLAYNNLLMRSNGMVVQFSGEADAQEIYSSFCNSRRLVTDSDQIYDEFLSTCCVEQEGARTTTHELYDSYSGFCTGHNYPKDNYLSFSVRIAGMLKDFVKKRFSISGEKVHAYENLALR